MKKVCNRRVGEGINSLPSVKAHSGVFAHLYICDRPGCPVMKYIAIFRKYIAIFSSKHYYRSSTGSSFHHVGQFDYDSIQ